MKKCPSCQKTYDDDNLKFCQTDGTPLVAVADEAEVDPYKTVVGNQADISNILAEQDKQESKTEEPEADPFKTMVAPPPPPKTSQPEPQEDIQNLPDEKEEEDPMKTMVISGDTADNIRVNAKEKSSEENVSPFPDFEPKSDHKQEDKSFESPAPEPPQFDEPSVELPNFNADEAKFGDQKDLNQPKSSEPQFGKENQGIDSKNKDVSDKTSSSIPIPSPFDKSMPPGYAPPSTPPFEPPKEPLKPKPLNEPQEDPFQAQIKDEPKSEPPKSPFAEPEVKSADSGNLDDWTAPPAPVSDWENKEVGQDMSQSTAPAAEGQNMTLAYASMALGILNVTICCGSGLLLGTAAIVIGFLARGKAKENPNEYGGEKFALIGMITGGLGIILSIVLIIVQIVLGGLGSFL